MLIRVLLDKLKMMGTRTLNLRWHQGIEWLGWLGCGRCYGCVASRFELAERNSEPRLHPDKEVKP